MQDRRSQRRSRQPVCETLESRELLSTLQDLRVSSNQKAAAIHTLANSDPAPASILNNLTFVRAVSTVPAVNGDLNPSGVAFVPGGFLASGGELNPGDILVSNFNNSSNVKGTGTTIVKIAPNGTQSVFYQSSSLGLNAALGVLYSGFVLVGNLPSNSSTAGGTSASAGSRGTIQVLNKFGNLVQTLAAPFKLNGPWDMTVVSTRGSGALVFISNVLSGTVWRLKVATRKNTVQPIQITSSVEIGSGFPHGVSSSGLVAGPGGLAYNPKNQTLYVASQLDNSIYAIPTAGSTLHSEGRGKLIVQDPANLHGPMGLVLAPNGNLIVANSDAVNVNPAQPSELVEYTPKGAFVGSFSVDPETGGAFGLAISPPSLSIAPNTRTLAAVDDNFPNPLGTTPVLEEYTFPS